MGALAALHELGVREGDRWAMPPGEIVPSDVPLHRLGFASGERDAAAPGLEAARAAILGSPWGFIHGDATAAYVLLAPGDAWLTGLHNAGYGPALYDVAALLLTSGVDAETRRSLALSYAGARGFDGVDTADLADVAGILWGIRELLTLPRRTIELMGDDVALHALNTAAGRIERGIREAAGSHPAAAAIRAALWPA
jgi:hypothetical protein